MERRRTGPGQSRIPVLPKRATGTAPVTAMTKGSRSRSARGKEHPDIIPPSNGASDSGTAGSKIRTICSPGTGRRRLRTRRRSPLRPERRRKPGDSIRARSGSRTTSRLHFRWTGRAGWTRGNLRPAHAWQGRSESTCRRHLRNRWGLPLRTQRRLLSQTWNRRDPLRPVRTWSGILGMPTGRRPRPWSTGRLPRLRASTRMRSLPIRPLPQWMRTRARRT